MTRYNSHLIWGVGLLALAMLLMGCQPLPDNPIDTEPAQTATLQATESVSLATAGGYQEGFTDDGEPFRGNPDAPVLIEEFSSFQCPFCGKYFRESYTEVMANYVQTGRALYVFRDFPLPSQLQSSLAAEAANCAGQVGGASAFWEMHDQLLGRQAEWSGRSDASDIFKRYGAELGLDAAAFDGCLDSGETRSDVEADAAEGSQRGVRGTPTFFINGQALVGAQPYSVIAEAIDAARAGETPPAIEPTTPAAMPTPAAIVPADDALVLGDPGAPVTIVEFSDYQCPFCARYFLETWPRLKVDFVDTGRVRYVFKDYPLTSIHPQAPKAHEAARCAGEQGAYWEMHDQLFGGQSEWANSSDPVTNFKEYAAELGLDKGQFDSCLDGGRLGDAVYEDLAEGARLGVQGTPTFFVDGYPLVGAQPFEAFQLVIDLAEQGTLGDAYRPRQ